MSMKLPHQNVYFFEGKWTPHVDKMLLSTILRMRGEATWKGNAVPAWIIYETAEIIRGKLGVQLSSDDLKERPLALHSRYRTFHEVIARPGTFWNVNSGVVLADDMVWKKIIKKNPSTAAYYHRDEPEFHLMSTLFGLVDVEVEESKEVIVVSSSTDKFLPTHVLDNSPSLEIGEVNSPTIGCLPRVRRKLFIEDEVPTDRLSSNVKPGHSLAPCPRGVQLHDLDTPPRKSVANNSPFASSCASWSPFPTSRKTAP